jgi:hypothetical protein
MQMKQSASNTAAGMLPARFVSLCLPFFTTLQEANHMLS